MKKRRASGDLQPAKNTDNLDARRIEFAQTLRALNSQFCSWVEDQNRSKPAELWSEGVEDYLTHAKELLSEFSDVIDEEEAEEAAQAEAAVSAPSFAPAAATEFGVTAEPSAAQQPQTGFGGSGGFGGGGATFGQPPSSSQAQQKQASVADFLKTIPAPAAAAATSGFGGFGAAGGGGGFGGSGSGGLGGASSTGLGDGAAAAKLPPLPFSLSGGKDGSSGGGGGGGGTALGTSPPAFNFSTAFGGGDSTAASSPSSGPAAAASQKSSGFGAFGSGSGTSGGGTKGFGLGGEGPAGAGSGGASGGVFGSSKPPPFGGAGGGYGFGAPAAAASTPAAAESSPAVSAAPASESKGLFSSPPSQPLPSLFSFATGNAGTSGGFNFGSAAASAPAQNGNSAAAAAGDDDVPDENPEDKVKVQLDETGADILFRDNAKLYFQDKVTKKWDDRGRGNLTLRRTKQQPGDSGSNTPFLVFTMESGRVLLSASLYKGLSMQQQKNMVLMTLEVADPSGGEGDVAGKPTMTLVNFRLKTAERGGEFQDAIKEHIPK